jgi:hypothetical protein
MEPQQSYLNRITIDMPEIVIKDIVREMIGPGWDILNDLQRWIHYDNALSHQEKLKLDRDLSTMLRSHQVSHSAALGSPQLSSLSSTPHQSHSPSLTPSPLDEDIDFAKMFYHVVEFSTYVLEQTQFVFSSKVSRYPGHVKPTIPESLSVNEVIDANYIAGIASRAMCNPGKFLDCSGVNNADFQSFGSMGCE